MKVKVGAYQYHEFEIEIDDKFKPLTRADFVWDDPLIVEFFNMYEDETHSKPNERITNQLPAGVDLSTICSIKTLDGTWIVEY